MTRQENGMGVAELEMLEEASSWEEMQERFATYLGWPEPVPTPVLRRMTDDTLYRHYVMTARNRPELLKMLFRDKKNDAYAEVSAVEASAPIERSNTELLRSAASAIATWGKSGFKRVDNATFERRFGACKRCKHLVDWPDNIVYRLKLTRNSDIRVCDACGCTATLKARVETEFCPVADPDDPTVNRWGQSMSEEDATP